MLRLFVASSLILLSPVAAAEVQLSGNVSGLYRGFTEEAANNDQESTFISISAEPEWYWEANDVAWTVTPFARLDSADENRSHADIRELNAFWYSGDWEWRVGLSRVFWGVTESQHLVDVINQTDGVEGFDGEDKLGQPMIHGAWYLGDGVVNFFLLPGFRERTFPSEEGRLRTPLVVDTDQVEYESSDEAAHVDVAIRWTTSFDVFESGLSYFNGTNRDPEFLLGTDGGEAVLIPRYNQMQQIGWDVQATTDAVIWKLETVHRQGEPQDFTAAVGGFEYTFVGVMESDADVGWLVEYHVDDQGKDSIRTFQNDLFTGARVALNDADSSEALIGLFYDLDYSTTSFRLEASRRIGQQWTVSAEAQLFESDDPADPSAGFDQEDYLQLEVSRYF